MVKKYIYNGSTFSTSWGVRAELAKRGVLFGEEPDESKEAFWALLGVAYTEVAVPVLSQVDIQKSRLASKKKLRDASVAAIVVDVDGNKFDGDEKSQQRMLTAIESMQISGLAETQWVMTDNSVKTVTLEQLKRAFVESSKRTRDLWIKPYTV